MSIRPGLKAPDFELDGFYNGKIQKISLSDYKGKWVLLVFYPADFTFVCPTELVTIARRYKELRELDVEVLAISIDTPFVHKVWQEVELSKMIEGGVPYPLLSDLAGKVGKLYGVYDEDEGLNLRGTFLIDPDGVIQFSDIVNAPVGRNVEELIRRIKAFQHVRQSGGQEVCPAQWEPGKNTLKPGADLAGKVFEVWNNG
ncbi:thioredoxin-dependent peroxiredoxin [Thermodesulforhabdus norvegica]|uniref:Alkyl hydroperoxide reductase C n=1 Tax=Thermodesulforhabdus norvegica TaxID=39841 RepID=A0A1I4U9Q4_9BACT|nr:thioredoxin-dependent peroxiredoxin [Thermodesulforhabdus norvegica]SFM85453.1 peroxiredoxin (alkyl hydroperoxide reductase subunit C) [Thermodesulforhabdus norvegica]